jgi:hypothetical protein
MPLDETFTNLAAFLNSLDAEGEQKFELSHSLVIICPDCGKNIAFRGRCPKCAGNSWIPAGHAGGIFDRTKAQRLRRMIQDDDVTMRGGPQDVAPSTMSAVPDAPPLGGSQAGDQTLVESGSGDATVIDENSAPSAEEGGSRGRRRGRNRNH